MSRQERRRRERQANRASAQRQQDSRWLWLTFGGVLVAAVVVIVVLFAAGVFGGADEPDLSQAEMDELISESHLVGDPNAPVKLIEFADFQCPFCSQFWGTTLQVIKSEFIDTGQAALYFHHMAFIGPESRLAAQASECAAEQGRFEDYHDILFERQGPENEGYLTQARLESFATEIGLDVPAFSECLSSGRYASQVQSETDNAAEAGIRSTPTLVVDGNFAEEPLDPVLVRQMIIDALNEAQ